MKLKPVYVLGIVLLALVAIFALSTLVFKDTGHGVPGVAEIKNLNRIEVKKGTNAAAVFTQTADLWKMTAPVNDVADKNTLDAMIVKLKEFKLTDLASEGDFPEKYNLDTNNRIEVAVYQDKRTVAHFFLGKTASTYSHSYVQLPKSKNVYLAAGNLTETFDKTIDSFRSKDITSIMLEDVKELSIASAGREITLAKTQTTITNMPAKKDLSNAQPEKPKTETVTAWKVAVRNTTVKDATMTDLLTRTVKLSATSFTNVSVGNEFIKRFS
ncbi:MAG: DUF4340 domain-containing protein, partial [Spirochaetota bacterium]